ncbi:hypothetical protein [Deinococcus cellulosilyticus]|nr:hypothetical protein [Deinococcus cellulosilyticus]
MKHAFFPSPDPLLPLIPAEGDVILNLIRVSAVSRGFFVLQE